MTALLLTVVDVCLGTEATPSAQIDGKRTQFANIALATASLGNQRRCRHFDAV
jgi:hypothetical protein